MFNNLLIGGGVRLSADNWVRKMGWLPSPAADAAVSVNHNHENRYRVKKSQSLFLSDGAPPPLQSLSTAADEKTEERPPAVTRPTCLGQRNAFFLAIILKGKPQMLSITMREDAVEISP